MESAAKARNWPLIIAVAITALVAVGLIVWLPTEVDDSESPKPAKSVDIVEQQELQDAQKSIGHPIYWVGPQSGQQYELTKTRSGSVFLRYLPPGTKADDPRPQFLSVGTYPYPNAFGTLLALSKKKGSKSARVQGGLAVSPGNRRQSVYLAYPGQNYQIEVYDPSARKAFEIVKSGQVEPVG